MSVEYTPTKKVRERIVSRMIRVPRSRTSTASAGHSTLCLAARTPPAQSFSGLAQQRAAHAVDRVSTITATPAALPQPRVQRRMPNSNPLVAGTGPQFISLGRLVKYRECDLAAWVQESARLSRSEGVGARCGTKKVYQHAN